MSGTLRNSSYFEHSLSLQAHLYLEFSVYVYSLVLRRYIKHARKCFTTKNISKFVKNTPLWVVFSTLFSVFESITSNTTLRQFSHGFATRVHGFATKTRALAREIPPATQAIQVLIAIPDASHKN